MLERRRRQVGVAEVEALLWWQEHQSCWKIHNVPRSTSLVWSDNVGMRRWMFMAALSVALLVTPLWAQRGGRGGMAVGGARGGSVGAPHSGTFAGGVARGGFVHGPYPGHLPYYPGRYPFYPGRYPWWGYRGYYGGWGYPWAWGWYGGVGWSGDNYSYPDQSYPVYAYSTPDNGNAYVTYDQQQEIDRLNDEVARRRADQQSGAAQNSAQPSAPKTEIHGDTVLVFRDRHTEEIQNYAIIGKTLWVFTEQQARKIPIAELNVPATTKANEARGIDFRLPGQ
jgi:hypothetical protein